MAAVTVRKKEELESAVNNCEDVIVIAGDLAQQIISEQKKKSVAKNVGIIGGPVVSGLVAVVGFLLERITDSISKNYDVKVSAGSATVICTRKNE